MSKKKQLTCNVWVNVSLLMYNNLVDKVISTFWLTVSNFWNTINSNSAISCNRYILWTRAWQKKKENEEFFLTEQVIDAREFHVLVNTLWTVHTLILKFSSRKKKNRVPLDFEKKLEGGEEQKKISTPPSIFGRLNKINPTDLINQTPPLFLLPSSLSNRSIILAFSSSRIA